MIRQTGSNIVKAIGYRNYNEKAWKVACDYCGKETDREGVDAGAAADAARFEGFQPISCGLTAPMRWSCPVCQAKRIAAGKASAPIPAVNVANKPAVA